MLRKFSSILVVLVLVLLLLSLATGCGGGSDGGGVFHGDVSTSTPEATVMSMCSAVNNNDVNSFVSCFVPEDRDEVRNDMTYEDMRYLTLYNIQTSLEYISDDWAEVYTEYDGRMYGEEAGHESRIFDLERRGDEWLILYQLP